MIEIDPLILVAVAIAVIAIIVFSFFSNSVGKKSRVEDHANPKSAYKNSHATATTSSLPTTSATPAAATAAKKRKPKSKPKPKPKPVVHENKFESLAASSANEGDEDADDDDSVASDAIIPSKAAQALLKKSKADAKAATELSLKPETKEKEQEKKKKEEEKTKADAKKAAANKKGTKKVTVVPEPVVKSKEEAPVVPAPAPVAPPAPVVVEVHQPKTVEKVEESDSDAHLEVTPAAVPYDGWAVVEDKRKSKPKKEDEEGSVSAAPEAVEETKAEEPQEPAAPVEEVFTEEVIVDAKKLGLLIGPKGVTKIAIQTASGATINMPKTEKETTGNVTITITGPKESVKKASHAINELIAKGYATLIAAEDFQESYVAVHHKFLPDIIGKAGSVIRALNTHTGVKITVPQSAKTPGPDGKIPKVKIGLAGPKEKVSIARSLIKDLTKYYVTPVTHPDQTYAELDIAKSYYNFIIGSKGSEIKHIQNSYKVSVHIPDENSVNPNIVIVGTVDAVDQAKKHIDKIIERVDTAAAAKAAAAAAGTTVKKAGENGAAGVNGEENTKADAPAKPVVAAPPGMIQLGGGSSWAERGNNKTRLPIAQPSVEEEEAWTKEFLPPSSIPLDIASILPPGAKYATSAVAIGPTLTSDANPTPSGLPIEPKQPANASAWNNIPGQW